MPFGRAGTPAPGSKAAAQKSATRTRPVLTGRAMVLGAIVVLLVVVLASPLQRYLGSRNDVGQAATQLHRDRATLARLAKLKALYGDPAFVEDQARKVLEYAMPGDTVYQVSDQGAKTQIERTSGSRASSVEAGRSWNVRLWNSVSAAAK